MLKGLYNSVDFYKKALDGTWARNNAIASNIANVNTPNYKRKYVTFEEQLRNQINRDDNLKIQTTNIKHIGHLDDVFEPKTLVDNSGSYRLDGNNVNIDTESAESAKNSIMYDAITRHMSSEFDKIKSVITEGSK